MKLPKKNINEKCDRCLEYGVTNTYWTIFKTYKYCEKCWKRFNKKWAIICTISVVFVIVLLILLIVYLKYINNIDVWN